jgi:hypothetical protein
VTAEVTAAPARSARHSLSWARTRPITERIIVTITMI